MSDSNKEKTVGEIIAAARKARGLSLRDLSSKLDIHFTYLADIEKNNRKPSEKVLRALGEQNELSLNFDELMAKVGRLGSEAEEYLREHLRFGSLIRLVVGEKLTDPELLSLSDAVSETIQKIRNSR